MDKVRVRFAPSPTGYLHIGGLRTALFNYLFARNNGGDFILRLEDTDRTRYVDDAFEDIVSGMKWLGIEWDEGPDVGGDKGPYVQSERNELYKEYAEILIDKGFAYKCFCSSERLAEMREEQKNQKSQIRYDRKCLTLTNEEIKKNEEAGLPYVIRLQIPHCGETVINDYLRGEVGFKNSEIDDFILLKSDGMPTYHFANIIDDHLMEISHVLRGEEWISSTPKHVILYNMFGWEPPVFVHLPVILSPKGGKLSKRDGATEVREFINKGYLKEAMLNFLALLGWSLDGSTYMFNLNELKKNFTLDKIGLASPVFDVAKLNDYNAKYIRMMDTDSIADLCIPFMVEAGLIDEKNAEDKDYFKKIIPLIHERITLLSEIVDSTSFFFKNELDYGDGESLIPKKTTREEVIEIFNGSIEQFELLDEYTEENIESMLRNLVEILDFKGGQIFMALRIAITGSKVSPGLFETINVLGKARSIKRLKDAVNKLEEKK